MEKKQNDMSRREFLRRLGLGAGSAMAMMAMEPLNVLAQDKKKGDKKSADNRMTYRVQHGSGEQISLLGFGMMRLPNNQDEVNQLVDYAIEHGVNYYDTAPMYMGGQSEVLMGNALSRHPRDKFEPEPPLMVVRGIEGHVRAVDGEAEGRPHRLLPASRHRRRHGLAEGALP
jgi:hypothetical protein